MIVKLIEAKRAGGTLALEEVFVNTEHVTCVRAAAPPTMYEGQLPEGLDKRTEFCKVFLDHGQNGIALLVVGTPALIESKINKANRRLLKG